MNDQNRTAWVDVAKGVSILLVVTMYSAYNTGEYTGGVGFLHYVIGFATPFRMPEFFLISGLFLSRVIDRPWRSYADRRIVHYFYFYLVWAFIMIALKVGVYGASPTEMAHDYALALVEPYGVLWFVYLLGVFGAVIKLCRQIRIPHWIVVSTAAVLQMAQVVSPSYIVQQFAAYFVFYYAGYVFSPLVFRVAAWAQENRSGAAQGLAAWALANGLLVFSPGFEVLPTHTQMGYAAFPPVHLALALAGAVALCVFAALVCQRPATNWLRWLGEHSLVVYLAFTIPMSLFRAFALWSGIITQTGPLSAAVLVVSVVTPVALFWIVKRSSFGGFLFERPDWAHINAASRFAGSNLSGVDRSLGRVAR
ncbi:MAG: acyltransferase family protein [Hyphomicrobiales bacterium]|nr:acyltransferase family protein [Hyphomicrobiales bacterium]